MQHQHQQKRFGFQPAQKPLKLLALAFALTAAAAIFIGFQIGTEPLEFELLIPIAIQPPFNRLFLWGFGLAAGVFAARTWKQANAQQGKRFELVFSEEALLMRDPQNQTPEQVLFALSDVRSFSVRETGKGKWLDIRLVSGPFSFGVSGSGISSADMDSPEEFDALVTQLRERVGSDKEQH